jgi:uncharacterized protein (TIGR02145 family)
VLIGVKKKGTTEYLWSWHLWLTNYNPDNAPLSWQEGVYSYPVTGGAVHRYSGGAWATAAYTDKFIMDRNFGAASAARADGLAKTRGLYYQFGRKEPFPAASVLLYDGTGVALPRYHGDGDCISRVSGATALKTAVQHPCNFYCPESGDWLQSNPYAGTSWNNPTWQTSTTKSLFDPCPPGWWLPVDGTWNRFALAANVPNATNYPGGFNSGNDQFGWEFYMSGSSGETAFYPASGFRAVATGVMSTERGLGYGWSSTPNGSPNARYWYFNATHVVPQGNANRASGFPARCIQE